VQAKTSFRRPRAARRDAVVVAIGPRWINSGAIALSRALSISPSRSALAWWLGLALLAAAALLAPPLPEPAVFRSFIDEREIAGVPYFWNVLSNVPLLLVGAWGICVVARAGDRAFAVPPEKWPYYFCFGAVALAGLCSAWFHLAPDPDRLMWDRLPIALGFMALLSAVIAERVSMQAGLRSLAPLLVAGATSVWYWRWSMVHGAEDIVPYALVQYGALAAIVLLAATMRSRYTRSADVFVVAAIYALAKVAEVLDAPIYALGHVLSGHTLKHLLAALAVWWLVRMLQLRAPVIPPSSSRPIR
jgi:hypothetical protein